MNPKRRLAAAVAVVLAHVGLISWSASQLSPTTDEVGHLAAGLSHWMSGRFDLYRVNPPLVRLVATLPLLATDHGVGPVRTDPRPGSRPEGAAASILFHRLGARAFWYLVIARWACIPFSLLGAYVCHRWAGDLYGDWAALLALVLWCFSPNVLAHAQLITPDAGAAALGVAAGYSFWRWLKTPTWGWTLAAGLVLGLAELTKVTWILLFLLWPALWLVWRRPWRGRLGGETPGRDAAKLAVILLLGVAMINAGYGFEDTWIRLGDYEFVSRALGGPREPSDSGLSSGNRFAGSWLADLPVPLPRNYVLGIDSQRENFESTMPSYLRGQWRDGGWWYYYLYALAIKEPVGTLVLALMALIVSLFARGYASCWRDEVAILAPLVAVLALVSSHTGFNHHLRYVLPAFPFAFTWISRVARANELGHRKRTMLAVAALAWSLSSALWIYPFSLSYFNEFVGGPLRGHAHLLDSNIDWGQDLFYLKRWADAHPEAKPLRLAYPMVSIPTLAGVGEDHPVSTDGPRPGWHAASVSMIRQVGGKLDYFLRFRPVATAGYSIYIYHITPDQANRARRELGLPELPQAAILRAGEKPSD